MMKKAATFLLILLYAGLLSASAQEQLYPIQFNPAQFYGDHYQDAQQQISGSRENYDVHKQTIYLSPSLTLPFVDDFSSNTLRPFKTDPSTIVDSGWSFGPCIDNAAIPTTVYTGSSTPNMRYTFDTSTKHIDSFLVGSFDTFHYYGAGSSCFNSYAAKYFYPGYFRYVLDTLHDTIIRADSVFVYDTVLNTQFIYIAQSPSNTKWMDNYAWVNNTYPLDPPSIGVATLDGLNEYGLPYDKRSATRYGVADYLTSRPINLGGFSNADSIYLSFFYEPMGIGNWPNLQDSLILEIRDGSNNEWYPVWADTGSSSVTNTINRFRQVMYKIHSTTSALDPNPFYNTFQFRFKNYASLAGNNDHWHIDYVRLDQLRSQVDTAVPDIALVYPVPSILKYYSQMPWDQFQGTSDLTGDIAMIIKNNNPVTTPTVDWDVKSNEQVSSSTLYSSSTLSFPSDPIVTRTFNPASSFTCPLLTDNYYYVNTSFETTPSSNNLLNSNDTSTAVQPFTDELAYDDGSAERAYGIDGLGLKKFAYQFHLNKADTLSAIRVMFSNIDVDVSNLVFSMYVWDTLGIGSGFGGSEHVIKEISSVKPHYVDSINGWTTYVLDTPLILNHEFFIGWSQSDVRNLQIGYDLNSTKGRKHMFVNFGLGWDSSYIATIGSPMIRAVLNGHYNGYSTAVANQPENASLSLYPNPCLDKCYFKGTITPGTTYTVTDVMGNVLMKEQLWSREIDLHQLSAGMYFINVGSSAQHSLRVTKY